MPRETLSTTTCPPLRPITQRSAFGKHAWQVQLYADNLTDTRAELFANYRQYYKAVTVNRPRTVGLRLTYRIR